MDWMRSRWINGLWIMFVILGLAGPAQAEDKADKVVVVKSDRKMYLLHQGKVLMDFNIALGYDPVGAKLQEGDGRTPEGHYILDYKKADSDFYKAIHISYPSLDDVMRAEDEGVSPGGQIMIHGQGDHPPYDPDTMQMFNWTEGCIAVTNLDMEVIWDLVDVGTPIEIRP